VIGIALGDANVWLDYEAGGGAHDFRIT
jgi:hypothetical protein